MNDANLNMISLVQAALDHKNALARASFEAAKTKAKGRATVEVLMAAGIVVSCDDEYERAMVYEGTKQAAAQAGVSHDLYARAHEFARIADNIVADARYIVENGETYAEFAARLEAAATASLHPVAEGMKKPCKHNETKSARGLMRVDSYLERLNGNARFVCCRCGTEVIISAKNEGEPTPAAVEAAGLVAQFNRPEVA